MTRKTPQSDSWLTRRQRTALVTLAVVCLVITPISGLVLIDNPEQKSPGIVSAGEVEGEIMNGSDRDTISYIYTADGNNFAKRNPDGGLVWNKSYEFSISDATSPPNSDFVWQFVGNGTIIRSWKANGTVFDTVSQTFASGTSYLSHNHKYVTATSGPAGGGDIHIGRYEIGNISNSIEITPYETTQYTHTTWGNLMLVTKDDNFAATGVWHIDNLTKVSTITKPDGDPNYAFVDEKYIYQIAGGTRGEVYYKSNETHAYTMPDGATPQDYTSSGEYLFEVEQLPDILRMRHKDNGSVIDEVETDGIQGGAEGKRLALTSEYLYHLNDVGGELHLYDYSAEGLELVENITGEGIGTGGTISLGTGGGAGVVPIPDNLSMDVPEYMQHNQTADYSVEANQSGVWVDVTEDANITPENPDAVTFDPENGTVQSTTNTSINEQFNVTAEYDGLAAIDEMTVANATVENFDVLPSVWRVNALFGGGLGGPNGPAGPGGGAQFQFILFALLTGVVAARIGTTFAGVGTMQIVLFVGWFAGWVTTGVVLACLAYAIFAGLNLALNIDTGIG